MVDATKCLAWIVQAPGNIPIRYREVIGDRIYGCDDCQDVCPPNRVHGLADRHRPPEESQAPGVAPKAAAPEAAPERATVDLVWLLRADDQDILDRHGRWYIPDRNVDYLRRNALVIIGNIGQPDDPAIVGLLQRYLAHHEPMLRVHATWAAKRLGLTRLVPTAPDADPDVRAEQERQVERRFSSEPDSGSDSELGADR